MTLWLTLVTVLSMIDIVLFIYSIYMQTYLWYFLIYHVVSYILVYYFRSRKLTEYQGLPLYTYLFLPGLGPVIIAFVYLGLYKIRANTLLIEDYENYIRFQRQQNFEKSFDFDAAIQTLPAMDFLTHFDADGKKQLIADSMDHLSRERVQVLRQGNEDNDREVQHYAAVTLNKMEFDINEKLHNLHAELERTSSRLVFAKLLRVYKQYIESTLIHEESIGIYNKRYIDLLLQREERLGANLGYSLELLKSYIRAGDKKSADALYEKMKNRYLGKLELHVIKLHMDLEFSDIEAIKKDLEILRKVYSTKSAKISGRLKSQIEYWVGAPKVDKIKVSAIKMLNQRILYMASMHKKRDKNKNPIHLLKIQMDKVYQENYKKRNENRNPIHLLKMRMDRAYEANRKELKRTVTYELMHPEKQNMAE